MPKVFKVLSGKEVVKILEVCGFVFKSQTGSHIKMFIFKSDMDVAVIVPNHKELREGTMRAIRKQASQAVSVEDLDKYFKN
jgi:predicted RNA binding protein YcfA (HicA-like mRNA interferase family)